MIAPKFRPARAIPGIDISPTIQAANKVTKQSAAFGQYQEAVRN
jgi:hypothetical protein